jgi:1-phosphatidylinositol-4-phosphate 5-kinase
VIDGEHELYTLSIAVMIGVRTSISRTNTELNCLLPGKRWVHMADFRTTEKYEFHPRGDGPLPPHQLAHTFKFKDYSPLVFAYLRRMFGVNEFDFLLSVCGNANFIEFISNAKSGQFFFYSSDGRYMIKTMTNAESKFLRRILPEYFKHCCENPNTMITRFFGMYRVKLYHLRRNVKFVIMNSVYYTDKHLQTIYDLKGSSLGRDAKPGQAVLKDNDLRRGMPDSALALRPKQRSDVRGQVISDCDFLNKMDVMDYSMLVGVHHVPPFEGRHSVTVNLRKGKGLRARKNTGGSFGGDESEATDADSTPVDGATQETLSSLGVDTLPTKAQKRTSGSHHNRVHSDNGVMHSFEDGLEDDDNSYLMGSDNRPCLKHSFNEETERKMQATVEKLFWPFHHLFDIHGHRRLQPALCVTCGGAPCNCEDKDRKLLTGYNIPKFVAPLSDRKDGGLEMDATGLQLPMRIKGPQGELLYEGKIFYMGIIDILQEYSTRKALESRYRMFQSPTRLAASCVPPMEYGRRFIKFFDQYTKRELTANDATEEGVEISERA